MKYNTFFSFLFCYLLGKVVFNRIGHVIASVTDGGNEGMTEESEHHSPENESETQIPRYNGPNYNVMLYRKFTSTCLSDIASSPEVKTLVFDIDSRSIFAKGKQAISNRLFEALKKTIEAGIHVWILSNSSKDFLEFLTRKQKEQLPESTFGQIFMGGTYFKYGNVFTAISKFSEENLDLIKSGMKYHNIEKYLRVYADGGSTIYFMNEDDMLIGETDNGTDISVSNFDELFKSKHIVNVGISQRAFDETQMPDKKFSKVTDEMRKHFKTRTYEDDYSKLVTLYPHGANKLNGVYSALRKINRQTSTIPESVVVLSKDAVDLLAHYSNTIALQPTDSNAKAQAKCVTQHGPDDNVVASFLEMLIYYKTGIPVELPEEDDADTSAETPVEFHDDDYTSYMHEE